MKNILKKKLISKQYNHLTTNIFKVIFTTNLKRVNKKF